MRTVYKLDARESGQISIFIHIINIISIIS